MAARAHGGPSWQPPEKSLADLRAPCRQSQPTFPLDISTNRSWGWMGPTSPCLPCKFGAARGRGRSTDSTRSARLIRLLAKPDQLVSPGLSRWIRLVSALAFGLERACQREPILERAYLKERVYPRERICQRELARKSLPERENLSQRACPRERAYPREPIRELTREPAREHRRMGISV